MDTEDIILPIGPHARASRLSRIQALQEYGINPVVLSLPEENRHLAQSARAKRELMLHG